MTRPWTRTRRRPTTRRRRHERDPEPTSRSATATSSPNGPSPARRDRTTSRRSPSTTSTTACGSSSPTCLAARWSRRRWSSPNGAADEPPTEAGATVLAARALSEGTEHYDAIALIEASERLGASLHAEAGWDAFSAGVDVPADRLPEALELLAELVLRPTFPAAEVERLRDERLNDLLQAKADPRRRAEETFIGTIYAPSSPYHRPGGRDPGDRRAA